jgi:hypothetical protein
MDAISGLLLGGNGTSLVGGTQTLLSSSLSALLAAHLTSLVPDETSSDFLTSYLRASCVVISGQPDNASTALLSLPAADETDDRRPAAELSGFGAEKGVALSQTLVNLRGYTSPALSLRLLVTDHSYTGNAASTSRTTVLFRTLSTNTGDPAVIPLQPSALLVFQNLHPVAYLSTGGTRGAVACRRTDTAYNVSIRCSATATSSSVESIVTCPVVEGYVPSVAVNYTCASATESAACLVWNGTQYAPLPGCRAVAFSATNTSCLCDLTSPAAYLSGSRRLDTSASTTSLELTTTAQITSKGFVATLVSSGTLDMASLQRNNVIATTTSLLVVITVLGLVGFFWLDMRAGVRTVAPRKGPESLRSLNAFFDAALPNIFDSSPW